MSTSDTIDIREIGDVIKSAKLLATRYYALTGRPLGITGEVAEYEAARLLILELLPARQAGYDALRKVGSLVERVQIKGRCVMAGGSGQRVGKIDLKKEWDSVVLVLLDNRFQPIAIHEARHAAIEAALRAPGSRARNERGALSVSKFKAIGTCVWPRPP